MTYSWSFVVVAVALILTPGADVALILRNSIAGVAEPASRPPAG